MGGRQTDMAERNRGSSSWLNILLGIWVIISPLGKEMAKLPNLVSLRDCVGEGNIA
jgi:hypothetical protein